MSSDYIQLEMGGKNVYMHITESIGEGQLGKIFAVDIFNEHLQPIYINESNGKSVVCIKLSCINEEDVKFDRNEYNIGTILAKEKISPQMYEYFLTKNEKIKNKIIKAVKTFEVDDDENNYKIFEAEILRILVMQKLNGYTLGYAEDNEIKVSYSQKKMICEKLNRMHDLGIIHNDLHEDNIFLEEKEAYIIDFGLSQIIEPNNGSKSNYMNNIAEKIQFNARLRTLKNYLKVKGKTGNGSQTEAFGHDFEYYKDRNSEQYCKKAGWSCERGWQAEKIHESCSTDWGVNPKNYDVSKQSIIDSDDSGYVNN